MLINLVGFDKTFTKGYMAVKTYYVSLKNNCPTFP